MLRKKYTKYTEYLPSITAVIPMNNVHACYEQACNRLRN